MEHWTSPNIKSISHFAMKLANVFELHSRRKELGLEGGIKAVVSWDYKFFPFTQWEEDFFRAATADVFTAENFSIFQNVPVPRTTFRYAPLVLSLVALLW